MMKLVVHVALKMLCPCGVRVRIPVAVLYRYSNKDNYEDIIKVVKKKREIKEKNICKCGKQIKNKSKKCNNCHLLSLRKVERPTIEQLEIEIKELGYCGTGRKYGVSDNAIRKWLK